MNEKLTTLVGKCVVKGVQFQGGLGSIYTVQDLFHALSLASLNKLWKKAKQELTELDTDSLFENKNTAKATELQLVVDTLQAVFVYKQELAKAERDAEKIRQERILQLSTLKQIKTVKEMEKLGKKSLKDINKEIEQIEELSSTN